MCSHSGFEEALKGDFTIKFTSVPYAVHIFCIKCNYFCCIYLHNSPHVIRCLVVSVCLDLISCKELMWTYVTLARVNESRLQRRQSDVDE